MKSTIIEREQEQQILSARLSGKTSTDTWYGLDCIYLRFGYICDIKQTCDGHVKQKWLLVSLYSIVTSVIARNVFNERWLKDYCVAKLELGLT
jgi:hypothetical protein